MRVFLLLALVLLLVVVGLPLAMGMGDMGACPACSAPDAPLAVAMCLAILSLGALLIRATSSGRITLAKISAPRSLIQSRLDRPPQHA
jgi:hypothetical protein